MEENNSNTTKKLGFHYHEADILKFKPEVQKTQVKAV